MDQLLYAVFSMHTYIKYQIQLFNIHSLVNKTFDFRLTFLVNEYNVKLLLEN